MLFRLHSSNRRVVVSGSRHPCSARNRHHGRAMESSRRFTSSLYVRPERKVSRAHQEIKHARTMQISAARRFSSSRCFFNAGLFQRSGASDQIKPRPPPTSFTRCVPAWLGPWERTRCSASAPQRRYFAQVKWSSARHRAPGPELTLPPRARNSGRLVLSCVGASRLPVIPRFIKRLFPCGNFTFFFFQLGSAGDGIG